MKANTKATQKYQTPKINLYNGLRHSLASQRLNEGFSIGEVKKLLGHTDVRTTEKYASHLTETLADVMAGQKGRKESVHAKNTDCSQKSKNVSVCNLSDNLDKDWLGGPGFEPRLMESESIVLPLDDPPVPDTKKRKVLSA